MSWIIKAWFDEKQECRPGERVWASNGWTELRGRTLDRLIPHLEVTPLHRADCNFSVELARTTADKSRFKVVSFPDGHPYVPKPLINNKWIFAREEK